MSGGGFQHKPGAASVGHTPEFGREVVPGEAPRNLLSPSSRYQTVIDTRQRANAAIRHKLAVGRKASGVPSGKARIPSASSALEGRTRERMESAFDAPLGDVKIGRGGDSAQAARDLGARAFTVGNEVHFGAGQFAPGTKEGDHLIAHELAHVVQGQRSGIQRKRDAAGGEASENNHRKVMLARDSAPNVANAGAEGAANIGGVTPPQATQMHAAEPDEPLHPGEVPRANTPARRPSAATHPGEAVQSNPAPHAPENGHQQAGSILLNGQAYPISAQTLGQILNVVQSGYTGMRAGVDRMCGQEMVANGRGRSVGAHQAQPSIVEEAVGAISEALGGTEPPPLQPLERAIAAARGRVGGDLREAAHAVMDAVEAYNVAASEFNSYVRNAQRGAQSAVTGLQTFSTIAISVSTTVISAGIANWFGLGLLGTAAVNAGVSGGVAMVRETATAEANDVFDSNQAWQSFFMNIGVSAASGFVSSLISGAARPAITGMITRLAEGGAAREMLTRAGVNLANNALRTVIVTNASRILTTIPQSLLTEAFRTTLRQFGPVRASNDRESFMHAYWTNLERQGVARIIAQAIIANTGSASAPPTLR